jgi:hypothetical protein
MSQQINLYSPIFRKQEKVFSATTMFQGMVFIGVVIGVFYYTMVLQSSLLSIRAAESSQQLQGELARLKAYGVKESPAERAKAGAERRKALEAKLAEHTQALKALDAATLGPIEGYSDLLRAFARVSMEGVWLTRIDAAEGAGELSITGRAARAELVPLYLERLRAEAALSGHEFKRFEVVRQVPAPSEKGGPAGRPFVEFVLSSSEPEGGK